MRNKSHCPSLEDVGEQPIRGQIFSVERLEEYALYLAENLSIEKTSKISRPLLQRLNSNRKKLFKSYRTLVEAVQRKESISPAAEWLVDNFHVVEEQIREITKDLPPSYYRELPKISVGELTGYPRVYGIALALVAHTDSRLDLETIQRFIQTFQQRSYLNIGELWAIAITLRLSLVENVRRISLRVIWDHYQRQQANEIADRLISTVTEPERFKQNVQDIFSACEHSLELKYSFVAQLARRLRDQEVEIWPAVEFLENILKGHKRSIAEMVHQDHQMQAANQVTIANALSSMRLLSNVDWQVFFESVSLIDHKLKSDFTNDYQKMDFGTRNEYRGVIERIGKRTQADEREIAEAAVSLSIKEERHVGHFLIGEGVTILERQFFYRPRWSESWRRILLKYPMLFYASSLLFLIVLAVFAPIYYASFYRLEAFSLVALALLILIPASDLAVSFLNYFVTHLLPPRRLPKLDVMDLVPPEGRTLVVIPCMLFERHTIQELLEKLEVHYLGNISQEIYFALATDFKDADQEFLPEDADLISFAKAGIQRLNEMYVKEGEHSRFFLFHRARRWNAGEQKWMGWERKRGKLEELNDLLRGSIETSYVVVTCELPRLLSFKYIITLDADTQLGRDNAKKLIGTALHPLNRPVFDPSLQRVVAGYGVLQPRISISLESSSRSFFAMIFSGHTGIDPYTTAVSDVYQDLFGEGSFTGKGLYNIDAFRSAIKGRVPENTVLSHDLLEGLFARTALVTDVEFLDDYPKTYHSFWLRQHRWVRGDWQIISWILDPSLNWLSRWKIYDNLRRSLVGNSIVILMVLGWILLPGSSFVWTLFALAALALPCFLHVTSGVFISPRGVPWTSNFWSEVHQAKIILGQFFLTTTFLLHQAYIQLDAIVRALYRIFVSHRNCLEWMTAAQVDKISLSGKQKKPYWQTAWPIWGFIFAVAFALLVKSSVFDLLMALPLLVLWGSYPLVSAFISQRLRSDKPSLETLEVNLLKNIARRTWHFFDTFVGPYDHWLPPDNVQEEPELLIAHRTSPTNIGLYILGLLAAKDLGFLNLRSCFERLRSLCDTLLQLERYEGHFLNWYDTVTLAPLEPRYVSSVDSGNLAGYLLVLKQSCKEIKQSPLLHAKLIEGMQVSLNIIHSEIQALQGRRKTTSLLGTQQLLENVLDCQKTLKSATDMNLAEWGLFIRYVHSSLEDLFDSITVLESENNTRHYHKLLEWVGAQRKLAQDILEDLRLYAPWIETDFKRIEQDFLLMSVSLQDRWLALVQPLFEKMNLMKYQEVLLQTLDGLNELKVELFAQEQKDRLFHFQNDLMTAYRNVESLLKALDVLHDDVEILFNEMNFKFLIDPAREVFRIGYNVQEGRHDNSYYDLLASESRLASFVAIAKGDTSQKHWFRLGRQLVPVEGRRALVSWSASMFEYLMPQLVMQDFENTLLHETLESVVQTQIRYAQRRKVPWGISEAGYNARDINFNYQYGPFGIPGLGLKRGLVQDLVVSPYSTFLALPVAPKEAIENIRKLQRDNLLTCYGFYEAIDFTRERLAKDQSFAVIRSFMAHHQGMSLVAIANFLQKNIMQRRFHSELRVRATQALLQERVPHKVTMLAPKASSVDWEGASETSLQTFTRIYENPNLASPRLQILSNGSYSVMMTSAGGGYSKCNGLGVTRWREDGTRDAAGSFIFVKDTTEGNIWSTSYSPQLKLPDFYRVSFSEDMVEFLRDDKKIKTRTQIIVAPEDNVEIRKVTVTNDGLHSRRLEITSYCEPILSTWADDQAHPVFNSLFMETEFLAPRKALLARRRPRSNSQSEIWGFHSVVADGSIEGEVEYESDRCRFLGRGRSLKNAQVFEADHALSNTDGATLDPILSLRVHVHLAPGESCQISFNTGFARSREEILQLADRYHDSHIFEREKKLSWTKAHIDLRHFGIDADAAYLFQRLAERILFVDPSLRQPSHMLAEHTREQARLWPYGISGDLPLVVVTLGDVKDIGMLRKLLKGHEYLRLRGVPFDLVILNDSKTTYLMEMQDEIQRLIRFSGVQSWMNKTGGIFVLRLDTMPIEDRALMQVMARVDLSPERGSLKEQLTRKRLPEKNAPQIKPREPLNFDYTPPLILPALRFFNGLGGFSSDGKEYIIRLRAGQWTPAPWINVIANQNDFGFQVSESGSGFTWSINSRENRLTGWSNDPVSDPPTETIYLRDEDTGQVWTPTPLPIRGTAPYIIRHGQGYSVFEYNDFGFSQVLTLFVTKMDPVKVFHLRLKNQSERRRRVSITGYVEWVLGNQREKSAPYILTEFDEETGAILAKNSYNAEFSERHSFFYVHSLTRKFTCDRKEFIGRNGSLDSPEALQRIDLSSRKGIGLDPCGVLQASLDFDAQEEREVFFLLGQTENKEQTRELIHKYSNLGKIEKAYHEIHDMWSDLLEVVQVETPDPAVDILLNRWILYQALVCRMWARSAFYQSGGAYGFRDQLQDCMAFVHAAPDLVREHILRAASRQFPEGDVQHWWHPPTGRGVRTHFSDDLLWLPFVVSHYIRNTGDESILQERVSFIEAPLLRPEQEDSYSLPQISQHKATILEHCILAIERSLAVGQHGLPLIGSGDWNDGMNKVGEHGQGESVWMGWFLCKVLQDFIKFCNPEQQARYLQHIQNLKLALESQAWDGEWYRRAFFDDGTPLGSKDNDECKIDSISQSWSVLSGVGDPQRQRKVMAKVDEKLILWEQKIIPLLTPAFNKTKLNPGYIKGYAPGVRENGGQYTHAAIWVLMAFAELNRTDKVHKLFSLLNPIHHGLNRESIYKYKVEPYVIAADIYSVAPHVGRGGWSWYTGSASWFYRAGLESLLGFFVEEDVVRFRPCTPKEWKGFRIVYKFKSSVYDIRFETVVASGQSNIIVLENQFVCSHAGELKLVDDGLRHYVLVQNNIAEENVSEATLPPQSL